MRMHDRDHGSGITWMGPCSGTVRTQYPTSVGKIRHILLPPQLPPSYDQPNFLWNHARDTIHMHKQWFVTALPEASCIWNYECFMNNGETKVSGIDVCYWLHAKRETEQYCSRDTCVGKPQLVSRMLSRIQFNGTLCQCQSTLIYIWW